MTHWVNLLLFVSMHLALIRKVQNFLKNMESKGFLEICVNYGFEPAVDSMMFFCVLLLNHNQNLTKNLKRSKLLRRENLWHGGIVNANPSKWLPPDVLGWSVGLTHQTTTFHYITILAYQNFVSSRSSKYTKKTTCTLLYLQMHLYIYICILVW